MPVKLNPRGVGRRDYSVNIGQSTASANVLKAIKLQPNEKIKVFQVVFSDTLSEYPWVRKPLAPGESTHLIDAETGIPTPFIIPAGYDFWVVKHFCNSNESLRLDVYAEGQLLGVMYPGDLSIYIEQEVGLYKVSNYDPTLSSEHVLDAIIANEGETHAYGTVQFIGILKKVR